MQSEPRRTKPGAPFPVAVILLFVLSCASGGGAQRGSGDPTQVDFAPELGVVLDQMTRTSDGLYYHDLVPGDGKEAGVNSRVTIHYHGWHPDGTLFDSSLARGEPIRFTMGLREVIRGWELGIQGMRAGGQRMLVIPPELGYGSRGLRGVVPGNATLVFQVQLLSVE